MGYEASISDVRNGALNSLDRNQTPVPSETPSMAESEPEDLGWAFVSLAARNVVFLLCFLFTEGRGGSSYCQVLQ